METIKISWDDIEKKCKTLASRLKEDDFLPGVIIAISRGGTIIGTILSELLNIDMAVVSTKRYKDKIGSDYKTNYNIAFHRDFKRGERILLVDDIYDRGHTLFNVLDLLSKMRPNNLHSCVLLERENHHKVNVEVNFVGYKFDDDSFLVGYGLDYNGEYREIPSIFKVNE